MDIHVNARIIKSVTFMMRTRSVEAYFLSKAAAATTSDVNPVLSSSTPYTAVCTLVPYRKGLMKGLMKPPYGYGYGHNP